jgi:glycosyltransferase involved in cell wall biosynthesis
LTIPWSWTEHFAYFTSLLKLFEYMAARCDCGDTPSIREVLRHGENAWLVEPGDPKTLADGMSYILHDGVHVVGSQASRVSTTPAPTSTILTCAVEEGS